MNSTLSPKQLSRQLERWSKRHWKQDRASSIHLSSSHSFDLVLTIKQANTCLWFHKSFRLHFCNLFHLNLQVLILPNCQPLKLLLKSLFVDKLHFLNLILLLYIQSPIPKFPPILIGDQLHSYWQNKPSWTNSPDCLLYLHPPSLWWFQDPLFYSFNIWISYKNLEISF